MVKQFRSLFLCALMVLMTMAPAMTTGLVSAHASKGIASWPTEGFNDTGWLRLDATGADPDAGISAYADLVLDFPPGADISNISLGLRVDGSNGLAIDEPTINSLFSQHTILDWKGWGSFGSADHFSGNNPHISRMAGYSDNGAGWTLPAGAVVDELTIEALAPVDPIVSFDPFYMDIQSSSIHPDDGRMYLAINNMILNLDETADPHVIDMMIIEDAGYIYDLEVDSANDRLLVATRDDGLHSISLSSGTMLSTTPQNPVPDDSFTEVHVVGSDIFAASPEGLFKMNSAGSGWIMERMAGTSNWPDGQPTDMHDISGILYVSIWNGGVARWDIQASSPLTTWSTANNLNTDEIHSIHDTGSQILFSSYEDGISRYNHQGGFWQASWTDSNWLSSNYVPAISQIGDDLAVLAGNTLHMYDVSIGAFTNSHALTDFGLQEDGSDLIMWPGSGSRAPSSDQFLVSDGSGRLAVLDPAATPMQQQDIVIASGPSGWTMNDVLQDGNMVWVAVDENVDRFDVSSQTWQRAIWLDDWVICLTTANGNVFAGTESRGVIELDGSSGAILNEWNSSVGLNGNSVSSLSSDGDWMVVGHHQSGASIIDLKTGNVHQTWSSSNGLDTNRINDVAIIDEIAYLAQDEGGISRIDIVNVTELSPWRSTGVDSSSETPIAIAGGIMYLGITGYGVIRKVLSTGEFLDTWGSRQLPSTQVYDLHADTNGNIWIATQSGARVWDGQSMNQVSTGSGWPRPTQFFDWDSDSSMAYAASNAGICSFSLSTRSLDQCWDQNDGLPSNWMKEVMVDGDNLFAGSWYGAGLIDLSTEEVIESWEAGAQTGNAVVEIIGDIAYLALENMGVARFNLTTSDWLPMWIDGSGGLLDTDGVTSLAADTNPNRIWVGGDDGFQCLDWVNETEEIDIEKSSSLYTGNGDPMEIIIHNNILHYIPLYYFGDNVHRIDLSTMTKLSSLDAGQQAGINGYVHGIGMVGNHLVIGVGPAWNSDSDGAVVSWNTSSDAWESNWDPTGAIERVEVYESSNGDMWIAWGEVALKRYNSSGQMIGEWDDNTISFPVREILEYDGEILLGTQEGIARYDVTNDQWLSTWTPGSGMPSTTEEIVMDLWTDGADLWVGTAGTNWWGNPQDPQILRLDSSGNWDSWDGGQGNIPNGFPIAFAECYGYLHIVMSNNQNGGVARYNLLNSQWTYAFTRNGGSLSEDSPSSVACDSQETLYIGYYEADVGIDRHSYSSGNWLSTLDDASNGISSDRVWWDSMDWDSGKLIIGHGVSTGGSNGDLEVGGFSILSASGTSAGRASVLSKGTHVTSFHARSGDFLIGQAGGASGYSHVDSYSTQLGLSVVQDMPGLMNGNVVEIISNSTHVWVVTANSQSIGQGVLQGLLLPNGSVEWQFGWTGYGREVSEILLHDDKVWATVLGIGLVRLDPISGASDIIPGGLHNSQDGIGVYNGDLVVGLEGSWYAGAGIAVYDPGASQWVAGKLISGLPSNIVNDFVSIGDITYFATDTGLARWNTANEEWEGTLTTMDGLPANDIDSLTAHSTTNAIGQIIASTLYIGSKSGLIRYDAVNGSLLGVMTTQDGLMGNAIADSTLHQTSSGQTHLYVSNFGFGSARPGATQIDVTTDTVIDIHRIDQLPSNEVLALAEDWWGLHIATDADPLVHWNSSSEEFEDGVASWQTVGWPIEQMRSDGTYLVASSSEGVALIDPTSNGHSILDRKILSETTSAFASSSGIWVTTDSGLHGWGPAPAHTKYDSLVMRRADPLSATFESASMDISDHTHPGTMIQLVNSTNPQTISNVGGNTGPGGISMLQVPLILSSPVSGAATWAASHSLDYSGTWWLNETDADLETTFQEIVDGGRLLNGSRTVILRLSSPSNGSLEMRLAYDWVRTDSPVDIQEMYDRPNDGGQALVINWSLIHDVDFSRYIIYLNEGPWVGQPTEAELKTRSIDTSISVHSRTSTTVSTADGVAIQDGIDYWAVMVTEYTDGRWGPVSTPFGPANSSDEIPGVPDWAQAGPNEGGEKGELFVEWGRCDALDLAGTRIYHSDAMIQDVVGMTADSDVPNSQGNSTMISLDAGKPYWIGLTCFDDAGQEDKANALIIGPVVPTGGLNDGVPPPRVEGTWAIDVPEDEGGMLEVGWDASAVEDCAFYTVYMKPIDTMTPVDDDGKPLNVDDFQVGAVVPDCNATSVLISSIDGEPLIDGQPYWIGVVASDDWLNEDKGDVIIVEATPLRNLLDVNTPPDRILGLEAWDVPDDDGTAIEVQWTADDSTDFAYYIVWVANSPVSDLNDLFEKHSDDLMMCGCTKVQNQRNSGDEPLNLIINKALYGDDLTMSSELDIMPDVELQVAVTVHDIRGNVHLDGLTTAAVTPVDNTRDDEAPDRVDGILLSDYAGDAGDKLLLEFDLSDASDISGYEIYAATWNFEGEVGPGKKGPNNPIATLDRNPALPLVISEIFDDPLIPGLIIYVAVVAVDSNENAHRDSLNMVSAAPIDNLGDDPGSHLPSISELQVEWVSEGSRILVSWSPTGDGAVQSFKVYISDEEFDNVEDADLVETIFASNSVFITSENHEDLNNETVWWIGVTTSECGEAFPDCPIYRRAISPLSLAAPNSDANSEEEAETAKSGFDLSEFATTQNLLVAALGLAIIVLLVVLMKGRGGRKGQDQWGLESTWGIDIQPRGGGWDDDFSASPSVPQPDMSASLMSAASNIKSEQTSAVPMPDMTAQVPRESVSGGMDYSGLAGDLLDEPRKKDNIDTSFLDELL